MSSNLNQILTVKISLKSQMIEKSSIKALSSSFQEDSNFPGISIHNPMTQYLTNISNVKRLLQLHNVNIKQDTLL